MRKGEKSYTFANEIHKKKLINESDIMKIFLILLAMCLPLMANAQSNETTINETATVERPEGMIVHNTVHDRHVLEMEEYSYGETEMDKKAYAEFLKSNCLPAYTKYHQGQQMIAAGWSLFGLGLATTTVGAVLLPGAALASFLWLLSPDKEGIGDVFNTVGVLEASLCIGIGMTISSVVLLPIGYKYSKQSVDIFNNQCSPQRQPIATLNLQTSSDGIGLAITF